MIQLPLELCRAALENVGCQFLSFRQRLCQRNLKLENSTKGFGPKLRPTFATQP